MDWEIWSEVLFLSLFARALDNESNGLKSISEENVGIKQGYIRINKVRYGFIYLISDKNTLLRLNKNE